MLAEGAAAGSTPGVGAEALNFSLQSISGGEVTLSDVAAKGPVVLLVLRGFPGYQCGICNRRSAMVGGKDWRAARRYRALAFRGIVRVYGEGARLTSSVLLPWSTARGGSPAAWRRTARRPITAKSLTCRTATSPTTIHPRSSRSNPIRSGGDEEVAPTRSPNQGRRQRHRVTRRPTCAHRSREHELPRKRRANREARYFTSTNERRACLKSKCSGLTAVRPALSTAITFAEIGS